VILEAYKIWGKSCLQRFNGMFAFVIYDTLQRRVFAARDRFGIKPLYYWRSPEGVLAIASEIKQFTTLSGWKAKMNGQKAYDFLVWSVTNHTEETLFDGVLQLRGGQYFEWNFVDDYLPKVQQWYSFSPEPFMGTEEEAISEFYRLLEDSVRLRLRADVEVGSCLSGGLDSSSIVWMVHNILKGQQKQEKQKTFSAYSEDESINEKRHVENVLNACEVDSFHCYPNGEELLRLLEQICWHQDEPFPSTSIYAQWEVFSLAQKNQVKVMLDGQGADEHLLGYHSFFEHHLYDLFYAGQFISLFKEMKKMRALHGTNGVYLLLSKLLPEMIRQPLRKVLRKPLEKKEWINLKKLHAEDCVPFSQNQSKGISAQSYHQLMLCPLPMILHREDRDSMAHSIEARTPFLDHRLVEFVFSLPVSLKLNQGVTKKILRQAMAPSLPPEVTWRMDKIGFATAEELWMKKNKVEFRKLIEQVVQESEGILTTETLSLVDQHLEGKCPFSFFPWRVISFGQWKKQFGISL